MARGIWCLVARRQKTMRLNIRVLARPDRQKATAQCLSVNHWLVLLRPQWFGSWLAALVQPVLQPCFLESRNNWEPLMTCLYADDPSSGWQGCRSSLACK